MHTRLRLSSVEIWNTDIESGCIYGRRGVESGRLVLNVHDKGARVLHVEVVVDNAKEPRCGKVLGRPPTLFTRMNDMLGRFFLDTVEAAHASFLTTTAFEDLTEPTIRGTRRLAGIDLNKVRTRFVADAIIRLCTSPNGFTVAQLAKTLQWRSGQDATTCSVRDAADDAAKMLGKMLIHWIQRPRRYTAEHRVRSVLFRCQGEPDSRLTPRTPYRCPGGGSSTPHRDRIGLWQAYCFHEVP